MIRHGNIARLPRDLRAQLLCAAPENCRGVHAPRVPPTAPSRSEPTRATARRFTPPDANTMAIPLISANQRRLAVGLNSWLTSVVSRPVHSFAPIRLPLECRPGRRFRFPAFPLSAFLSAVAKNFVSGRLRASLFGFWETTHPPPISYNPLMT